LGSHDGGTDAGRECFLAGVLAAGCALVLALGVLAVAVGASLRSKNVAIAWQRFRSPLQSPGRSIRSTSWPSTFDVKTMWQGGRAFYQIDVSGYPPDFAASQQSGNGKFTFTFVDASGFKLFDLNLPLATMVTTVAEGARPIGLSWKGDEYLAVDLYRRAERYELTWAIPKVAQPRRIWPHPRRRVEKSASPGGSYPRNVSGRSAGTPWTTRQG